MYKGRLGVWILNDPCGKMEWMSKHERGLVLPHHVFARQGAHGPWVLQDTNYNFYRHQIEYVCRNEEPVLDEQDFEWSSDDDYDGVDNREVAGEVYRGHITILGFHPFKEIIFLLLGLREDTVVAYYYNSFKSEVLGKVDPKGYVNDFVLVANEERTIEGFPYVPCWLEQFPINT